MNKNSILYLHYLWQKYVTLLDPFHRQQMLHTPGYKRELKITKTVFHKFRKNGKIRSTKVENGWWQQNPLYVVNISNKDICKYYHWKAAASTWPCTYDSNIRRYCILGCWFCSQKCKIISYLCCLWGDILEKTQAKPGQCYYWVLKQSGHD